MTLHRRLYFILPDIHSARGMRGEMLLAGIETDQVHFLVWSLADDWPESGAPPEEVFSRDTAFGVAAGVAAGCIGGLLAAFYVPGGLSFHLVIVLIGGIAGASLGAWLSGIAASGLSSSGLEAFRHDIAQGRVLMMIDVPFWRARKVSQFMATRHPRSIAHGNEPIIPAIRNLLPFW